MLYGAKGGSLASTGVATGYLLGWSVALIVIGFLLLVMSTQQVARRRRRKVLGIRG